MSQRPISDFIKHHYRHFNAAALVDAAEGYRRHLDQGGKMLVCLAGAMSTAELGLSLAEMIRQDKVHAISCTGANLEEDVFNLVAHDHYVRIPNYRELTPRDEEALLERQLNRVTDTCIPEEEAMRHIEHVIAEEWRSADRGGERRLPHEYFYRILRSGALEKSYQIDPRDSWLLAACREEPAAVRARLGGLDARQHLRRALHRRQGEERRHRALRHRVHDRAGRLVPRDVGAALDRLLPDRRRHRRRLPDLRRADDGAGPAARATSSAGATSARSATRRRATAPTPAPCRTRRSPGASWRSRRRSSSSSPTRRSSRR